MSSVTFGNNVDKPDMDYYIVELTLTSIIGIVVVINSIYQSYLFIKYLSKTSGEIKKVCYYGLIMNLLTMLFFAVFIYVKIKYGDGFKFFAVVAFLPIILGCLSMTASNIITQKYLEEL